MHLPEHRIILASVYIPPKSSVCFHQEVEQFITETSDDFMNHGLGCNLIVTGDFNRLPLDKICSNNNLHPLVTAPTRGLNILDNVLVCDQLAPFYEFSIAPPLASSDHNVVHCSAALDSHGFTAKPIYTEVYDSRSSNIDRLLTALSKVNWKEFYNMSYTVDEKCEIFHTVLDLCISETLPVIRVRSMELNKPWLTPIIKHLINQRWRAYREGDFSKYNFLKDKVKNEIRKRKLNWGRNAKRSARDLWRVTNNAIGRVKPPLTSFLSSYENTEAAANAINSAFYSVFEKDECTVKDYFVSADWSYPVILPELVLQHLHRLKLGKAPGPDCIPNKIYKEAAALLAEPLAHLFNQCLSQGRFPSIWKKAHVVPVPKRRCPTITDFRPISLLSSPSKILERILADHLSVYFRESAGCEQHGALPGRSTATASVKIHDFLTSAMDMNCVQGVQLIAYDISKAFDKISHKVILSCLTKNRFPSFFVHLVESYLCDRTQRVKVGDVVSAILPVSSGVPQGSVLGPLLFVAVMGSLHAVNADTGLVKFVDDVTLMVPIMKGESNQKVAIENDNFRTWAKHTGLAINDQKSKSIGFQRCSAFTPAALPSVEYVNSHKILGVLWSNDLKWDKHFDSVSRIFASRLHCLRVLKNFLGKDELLLVYGSLLRSLFEYCSPVFVSLSKSNSTRLDRLQRRAHILICGKECTNSCLQDLTSRRLQQATNLFKQIQTPSHVLHALLPQLRENSNRFFLPCFNTTRRTASFFPFMVLKELGFN